MQVEPHDSLLSCEYHTFKCMSCGDTEQRLLTSRFVSTGVILTSMKSVHARAAEPQELNVQQENRGHSELPDLREGAPAARSGLDRINQVTEFIKAFVRVRERS
jgi:hypothetical protein